MEQSTTELTVEYIKNHPQIRSCLKKGIINYSSLARLISKDLQIEKKTSKEAILIAARRFQEKIRAEYAIEKDIKALLSKSDIEIKNKISTIIINKIQFEDIDKIQANIRKNGGLFYLLEGSNHYTIITQDKYAGVICKQFHSSICHEKNQAVLVKIISSKEIEEIPGVVAFITSLFSENGVNIIEFLSCWTDTLFVISKKDLNKTIEFLQFDK